MNPNDPNVAMMELVAERLGESLRGQMVFVGGAVTGLLISDPGQPAIRPTEDVDLIVRAVARGDYQRIEQALRKRGFVNDISNPRAKEWRWEENLIGSKQINAFCMPGGKIVFFTGILDQLKLTDDEVAMIMGHEIAHALWEHARERMAKSFATNIGASLLGELIGGGKYSGLFHMGGDLLTLKFSRSDETEADIVGLELAARAGYDPRAGITLWQKMAAASQGRPLEFLSTHPSGETRIEDIQRQLPKVMPLYEAARP
jgi:predicted Zn-dependent protease